MIGEIVARIELSVKSAKRAFVTGGKGGSIMSLLPKTNTKFRWFEGIIFTTYVTA